MTRETKIGLLVGMGVIILIGILISDHLSEARNQQFAQLRNSAPEVRGNQIPDPPSLVKGPTQTITIPGEDKPRTKPKPSTPSLAAAGNVGITQPADDIAATFKPALRTDGPAATSSRKPTEAAKPIDGDARLPEGFEFKKGQGPEAYPHPTPAREVDTIIQDNATAPAVTRAPAGAVTRPAPPVAAAPVGEVYNVKEGDTLYAIAKHFYGDGSTASINIILDANKKSLPSANRIRAGVRLVIPPKPAPGSVAAAKPAAAAAPIDPPARANPSAPVVIAAAPAPSTVDYKVKSGETLASIARDQMGTKNWQKLYDLNKDRIKDPNRVVPGTVIRVPAKKTTA